MTELYAPHEIASFLLQEKLAIHGVSPEVYKQNQNLIEELKLAANASSDNLVGVQIIGSRANGTSGLDSDIDVVTVTWGEDRNNDREGLLRAAESLGIKTDPLAAFANGVRYELPTDPADFIELVEHLPARTSVLFEDGIFSRPDLRLGQLAVTSILRTYPSRHERDEQWREVQIGHADAYLQPDDEDTFYRMQGKLVERLGADHAEAIRKLISSELFRQRREKFGLPNDMEAYHTELQDWSAANKPTLQKRRGWKLLRGVLKEL